MTLCRLNDTCDIHKCCFFRVVICVDPVTVGKEKVLKLEFLFNKSTLWVIFEPDNWNVGKRCHDFQYWTDDIEHEDPVGSSLFEINLYVILNHRREKHNQEFKHNTFENHDSDKGLSVLPCIHFVVPLSYCSPWVLECYMYIVVGCQVQSQKQLHSGHTYRDHHNENQLSLQLFDLFNIIKPI